jgi:hypothetical protein
VRDDARRGLRTLAHGTTNHGNQFLAPDKRRLPTTYYGPTSGVGLLLAHSPRLFGEGAAIGIVGLGTGTLACYRAPDQAYRFYEIDPVIRDLATGGLFTYIADCAPRSTVVIGDARIALEREATAQHDVLVIDAFSSDAIPLHLLTREAMQTYRRAIRPDGALMIHISNRFIDLEPVLAALVRDAGMAAMMREDLQENRASGLVTSKWVVIAPDAQRLAAIRAATGPERWRSLAAPAASVWSDQYASTLTYFRWDALVR